MRNGAYQVRILSVNSIERTEQNVQSYWKKTVNYCQRNC